MCGLIGHLSFDHKASSFPLNLLQHRGPDSRGDWLSLDRRCWFGHTRLAIQDLSPAGNQPITSHCGRITLVFNGEIYNHHDLRQSLRFDLWRGRSDSETLVEGLAQFGSAFITELMGMFAFAYYDNITRELFLARDRVGIKPLYFCLTKDKCLFSSEYRVLVENYQFIPQQLTQFLAFGHLFTQPLLSDQHLHSHAVSSVPPATIIRLPPSGEPEHYMFWKPQVFNSHSQFRKTPPFFSSSRHVANELRFKLETIVSQHLLSDVRVGCFLSSGLDSGILAALACRKQPGLISTFTIALPGTLHDESSLARLMATHCGSDHHELLIEECDALSWTESALAALDIPTADAINTYVISRAVSSTGIKVALSGLGADELFGGYPSHKFVPYIRILSHLPPVVRIPLLRIFAPRLVPKLQDLPNWSVRNLAMALRRWVSDGELSHAGLPPFEWPPQTYLQTPEPWLSCTTAELYGYTEPMLLRDTDAMSMASGLEVRVPFLDHQLVDFIFSLPPRYQRPGKVLLKSACSDLFPEGYLQSAKKGFALPMRQWMLGPLLQLCQTRLICLAESGLISRSWIDEQWSAFVQGYLNWPRAWSLVVLGEFLSRRNLPELLSTNY